MGTKMRKPLQADNPIPKQSDNNSSINASLLRGLKDTTNPALILFQKKLQKNLARFINIPLI